MYARVKTSASAAAAGRGTLWQNGLWPFCAALAGVGEGEGEGGEVRWSLWCGVQLCIVHCATGHWARVAACEAVAPVPRQVQCTYVPVPASLRFITYQRISKPVRGSQK